MIRTTEDWAANLLADTSDAMLLVWADWLETQEDPACEGVRELLVGEGRRPYQHYRRTGIVGWGYTDIPYVFTKCTDTLPTEVYRRLARGATLEPDGCFRWYEYGLAGRPDRAIAHYTALHDAATAYASMPEKWKRERRERVNKETAQ